MSDIQVSSDPVTSIGNALTQFFGGVKPFIDDYMAQKYENEFKDRLAEWNEILSEKDSNRRADRMQSYFIRLCADAGTTAGGLSENYSVPLAFLSALVSIAAGKIKADQTLANMRFK